MSHEHNNDNDNGNDATPDHESSNPAGTANDEDGLYSYSLHASLCRKCGQPRPDRASTRQAIHRVLEEPRPLRTNVFGHGPLLVSDVPASASPGNPIVLGIDEAGRGSVLGPMVYGLAYWSVDAADRIPQSFNDSKQLTEEQRDRLWDRILEHPDIGFSFKALLPGEISRGMLRTKPYNLNEQSHDTAMTLIRKLLDANLKIRTCYIDTVGNPFIYRRKLEQEFPGLEFVVESKADAKYAPCSAASVVAKVMRDRILESWRFSEPGLQEGAAGIGGFGSGYPSDPKCKAWMARSLQDPVFGYPDFVRFSWAPCKARLRNEEADDQDPGTGVKACGVTFEADLDEEEMENRKQQKGMSAFLSLAGSSGNAGGKKRKQSSYFESRKLRVVSAF